MARRQAETCLSLLPAMCFNERAYNMFNPTFTSAKWGSLWVELCPFKIPVEVVAPGTSERGLIWEQSCCKRHVKIKGAVRMTLLKAKRPPGQHLALTPPASRTLRQ